MQNDLLNTLDALKGQWMIGGSALEKAPATWRAAAQDDPHPDLALLAFAGQAMQFALRAKPSSELEAMPPLPRLNLPTPPQPAREQIRNLVRVIKIAESQIVAMIHLLAARGYVVHPTDYMPKSFQHLPDVYAPWSAWQLAEEASNRTGHVDKITVENWGQ
ncbi:MAG: hypothetical protein KDA51_03605, partial [Planctomycetales bacterium]|nr:hypothetical protein [Planctomycetales bacterium]